jgi:SAM-dependent methyltransferase
MKYRIDEILNFCKDKKVLHLGFVQHSPKYKSQIKNGTWLHAHIAEVASEIVGVDILEEAVIDLSENHNYKGVVGNVEQLEKVDLNDTFDVVVAGELIEHLENPGLFLQGVKRFLSPSSFLLITTPNAFGKVYQQNYDRSSEHNWVNEEHVMWFSHFTLKRLLERSGYKEKEYDYYFGYESRENDLASSSGLTRRLKSLKRKWTFARLPRNRQIGLFFVTQLKS